MKKVLALVLVLAMCVSMFAGCASGKKDDSAASADKSVEIVIGLGGDIAEAEIRKAQVELYLKDHPNVTVTYMDLGANGNERQQKILSLISTGEAPDIQYLNDVQNFASRGVLLPLDELIERDNYDLGMFFENLLEPLYYDGKLYALPQEVSPGVIYYNKDLFDAAGHPYPTDDWDMDDFIAAANATANPDENIVGFRLIAGWLLNIVSRNYGSGYSHLGETAVGVNTPEYLEALKALHKMVVVDKSAMNPADSAAMGQSFNGLFGSGLAAMDFAGLWMLPQYDRDPLPFEWDIVKFPKGPQRDCVWGATLNWGISKDSKNVDVAWDIIKTLMSPESMAIVAETKMAMPSIKDDAALDVVRNYDMPKNAEAFIQSAGNVTMEDALSPYSNEIGTEVTAVLDELLLDKITPEQAQIDIEKAINKVLEENRD